MPMSDAPHLSPHPRVAWLPALVRVLTVLLLVTGPTKPAGATGDPPAICEEAARLVADETGVPPDVLRAISLTETGRADGGETRPWPWTVNMEGKGIWFETEDDARAYVYEHFKRGARSFDVGCFQINYKWHHQGFASLDEMFDPLAGGRYAARFLAELYREKGSWDAAAGAYHSRTPELAERYLASFRAHRADLAGRPADATDSGQSTLSLASGPASGNARRNGFPLLQRRVGARSAGSLVPLAASARGRLIDFDDAG